METVIPEHVAVSDRPVAVIGSATPRPGCEHLLLSTLQSFVGPTRDEDGALVYEIHTDPLTPHVITFYEQWASGRHLQRHLETPVMQDFLAHRHDLLDGDLDIRFLTPLGDDGAATL